MLNNKFDDAFMQTAYVWAKQSYCKRRQVGAVIVKDNRILATGFNGTVTKTENQCEDQFIRLKTIHGGHFESVNIDDLFISYNEILEINKKLEEKKDLKYVVVDFLFNDKYSVWLSINREDYKSSDDIIRQFIQRFDGNIEYITNEFTVHAEQNVISFCAKHGLATNECSLYVTTSPCKQCAKLIAQSGIKEVIYKEQYKDVSGIEFLGKVGVNVRQI